MANIRERAKQILMVVPEPPGQINSDGPTAAQFTSLTGTPHETIWKNWEGGGIMTACNGFVGWYAGQLGSDKYLGHFDLETFLPTIGKGHAWAKSTANARPKYGDICRHTAFHVGVSLDFDGNIWNHVDAGQGGPVRKDGILVGGHDVLKRTRGTAPYDFKKLQGWIDLELYFESAAQTGPVPEWLVGWRNVAWRGQACYYYVDTNGQLNWTQILPRDTSRSHSPQATRELSRSSLTMP